jgi:Rha family phage regulatory protein
MKPQFDLFPETLIVSLRNGVPMTDSRIVAEYFGKNHKDVLKAIRNILKCISDPGHRRNFAPMSGRDERGRRQDFYLLTEAGFYFAVMGFTGEKAIEWKWKFIDAFCQMRHEPSRRDRKYTRALAKIQPSLIAVAEMSQKDFARAVIGGAIQKSVGSVTYYRRKARKLGLLAA